MFSFLCQVWLIFYLRYGTRGCGVGVREYLAFIKQKFKANTEAINRLCVRGCVQMCVL